MVQKILKIEKKTLHTQERSFTLSTVDTEKTQKFNCDKSFILQDLMLLVGSLKIHYAYYSTMKSS